MKTLLISFAAICGFVGLGWFAGASETQMTDWFKKDTVAVTGLCEGYSGLPESGKGDRLIAINGGDFIMAAGNYYPEEGQPRQVNVADFQMDQHEVTNAQFKEFVEATGYKTVAEQQPDPELHPNVDPSLLVPGGLVFADGKNTPPATPGGWWNFVPGANWRQPYGPGSSIEGKQNHPVVQISIQDAREYAKWKGRRLPTEAEWEFAARGGFDRKRYTWGDELKPDNRLMANTWQGTFPASNTAEDGFTNADKVGCYDANGYGLVDMIGNVWELTDTEFQDDTTAHMGNAKRYVIKGGSYLCAASYCRRYRPAARQGQEADLGSTHVGFRTVSD